MKPLPGDIDRVAVEREDEDQEQKSAEDLFSRADLRREEIQRQEHDRERAAIDEGKPLRTDGIVWAGEELSKEIKEIEILLELVSRRKGKSKIRAEL